MGNPENITTESPVVETPKIAFSKLTLDQKTKIVQELLANCMKNLQYAHTLQRLGVAQEDLQEVFAMLVRMDRLCVACQFEFSQIKHKDGILFDVQLVTIIRDLLNTGGILHITTKEEFLTLFE